MKKDEEPKSPDSFSGLFILVSELTEKLSELSKKIDSMMVQNESEELYSVDHLCKKLHISKRTFFEWKRKGLISCVQVGAKILIRQSDIESFLDNHQS